MTPEELKRRTKKFAIEVIRMVGTFPKGKVSDLIEYQLIKSATSVGANYRAACRAKSQADFAYKINVVEEEADESVYWLEIINEIKIAADKDVLPLLKEGNELTAIFTAAGKTANNNKYYNLKNNQKKNQENSSENQTITNPKSAIIN